MPALSAIVAVAATVPAVGSVIAAKHKEAVVAALLGYSALVGYLVAAASTDALAKRTTGWLGKNADGCISPYSWLVWWPYHLGVRAKLALGRALKLEPLYNSILPGWFLGGWPWFESDLPAGASVLDATCELPRSHSSVPYKCVHIWDTQAPSPEGISEGVAFALSERRAGRPVYVHCAHGHGRSALLLLACLLESGAVSDPDAGLHLMKSMRPTVHLNRRQRLGLDAWYATSMVCRTRPAGALQASSAIPPSAFSTSAAPVCTDILLPGHVQYSQTCISQLSTSLPPHGLQPMSSDADAEIQLHFVQQPEATTNPGHSPAASEQGTLLDSSIGHSQARSHGGLAGGQEACLPDAVMLHSESMPSAPAAGGLIHRQRNHSTEVVPCREQ